jgi:hypothetical protein
MDIYAYIYTHICIHTYIYMYIYTGQENPEGGDNSCQLLWQGIQAKRTFTGFKFQVSTYISCLYVCIHIALHYLFIF